jgi:hypothetical protein
MMVMIRPWFSELKHCVVCMVGRHLCFKAKPSICICILPNNTIHISDRTTLHDLMNWGTLNKVVIIYFDIMFWCLHGGTKTSVWNWHTLALDTSLI